MPSNRLVSHPALRLYVLDPMQPSLVQVVSENGWFYLKQHTFLRNVSVGDMGLKSLKSEITLLTLRFELATLQSQVQDPNPQNQTLPQCLSQDSHIPEPELHVFVLREETTWTCGEYVTPYITEPRWDSNPQPRATRTRMGQTQIAQH